MRAPSTLKDALVSLRELAQIFLGVLFSRHLFLSSEIVTEQPYSFLELRSDGGVELNGTPLVAGGTPIQAAGDIFVTRTSQNRVELADAEGLFDCFTFNQLWIRRCHRSLTTYSDIHPGLNVASNGELTFKIPGKPAITAAAGSSFAISLPCGSALVRVSNNGAIYKLDGTGSPPSEYVIDGKLVYKRTGVRSGWKYQHLGLPSECNEKRIRSIEVAPGVVINEGGSVEALHTLFLEGQPINLQSGDLTLKRRGGVGEPLIISSRGIVMGFAFTHFGEWVKLLPVSPEHEPGSWCQSVVRGNFIAHWISTAETATVEVKPLGAVHMINATIWRHAKAANGEPLLALLGPFIFTAQVASIAIRYMLLITAIPISLVSRLTHHVIRTFCFTGSYRKAFNI